MNSALHSIELQRKSVYLNVLQGAHWIFVEYIAIGQSHIVKYGDALPQPPA